MVSTLWAENEDLKRRVAQAEEQLSVAREAAVNVTAATTRSDQYAAIIAQKEDNESQLEAKNTGLEQRINELTQLLE